MTLGVVVLTLWGVSDGEVEVGFGAKTSCIFLISQTNILRGI